MQLACVVGHCFLGCPPVRVFLHSRVEDLEEFFWLVNLSQKNSDEV
jgi:hypothetical protein